MERFREIARLRWEFLVLIACTIAFIVFGISQTNLEALVFKFAAYSAAVALINLSRQRIFDYVCIEAAIFGEDHWAEVPVPIRCAVIAGMFFFIAVSLFALTQTI